MGPATGSCRNCIGHQVSPHTPDSVTPRTRRCRQCWRHLREVEPLDSRRSGAPAFWPLRDSGSDRCEAPGERSPHPIPPPATTPVNTTPRSPAPPPPTAAPAPAAIRSRARRNRRSLPPTTRGRHLRKTRRGENRSAIASSANTVVPAMKPSCTAAVNRPALRCRSGTTALIPSRSGVPANCVDATAGRMRRCVHC